MTDLDRLRGDFSIPNPIRFGAGRIAELPDLCKSLGIARPMVVTDPGVAALPMVTDAIKANEAAGLPTGLFSKRVDGRKRIVQIPKQVIDLLPIAIR